jgi:hypothetical protein
MRSCANPFSRLGSYEPILAKKVLAPIGNKCWC